MSERIIDPVTERPLAARYAEAVLTVHALSNMHIPPRVRLLGRFMHEGDIGFIFASRGVGKTWIAMLVANALSQGAGLGEWEAGQGPRNVLYVDGEMALADTQMRERVIGMSGDRLRWLHHEHLFNTQEKTLNIANADCQTAIGELLGSSDVLILDNLSALCRGVEENKNDDWEVMLVWLLSLRRRKITVIIVHHAGRNGLMRGASRREDAVDWMLRLADDTQDDRDREKAITSQFTKCRGCPPKDAMPMRWTLTISADSLTYTCKPHVGPDALEALVLAGVESASDCAEQLGVATGTISKWAQVLVKKGRIRKSGRLYSPPDGQA